jgi:hypothetical protein
LRDHRGLLLPLGFLLAILMAKGLALTFAQPVARAEVEDEEDEEAGFGRYSGSSSSGGWMR